MNSSASLSLAAIQYMAQTLRRMRSDRRNAQTLVSSPARADGLPFRVALHYRFMNVLTVPSPAAGPPARSGPNADARQLLLEPLHRRRSPEPDDVELAPEALRCEELSFRQRYA